MNNEVMLEPPLPGNDDSGAPSAWYVWNAVGLFPVPGQGIFLLGSPRVERAELTAGEGALVVSRAADGPGALYLHAVRLNGEAPGPELAAL